MKQHYNTTQKEYKDVTDDERAKKLLSANGIHFPVRTSRSTLCRIFSHEAREEISSTNNKFAEVGRIILLSVATMSVATVFDGTLKRV